MFSNKDEAHRRKLNLKTDKDPSFGHKFNAAFCDRYVRNKRVLDIGCWTGQMAQVLSLISKSYVGVDPSKDAINHAKKAVPNAKFLVGKAEDISFGKTRFDCVLLLDVIEHVGKNEEPLVYKKVSEILTNKGYLVITTPSTNIVSIILDPAYFLIGHRHYSLETISSQLQAQGLAIRHSFYSGNIISLLVHNCELIAKHLIHRKINWPNFIKSLVKDSYEQGGFAELHIIAQKISS